MVDWKTVVSLVQALAWPIAALVIAFLARPILLQLVRFLPGAKVSAAGFSLEIRPEDAVERAKNEIGRDAVDILKVELNQRSPADNKTPAQLYDAIISAWRDLTDTMSQAYAEQTGGELDWRGVHGSIDELLRSGILDRRTADAVRQLSTVRAQTRRRGPGGFEDLNMSHDDVEDYVASANALQRRIRPSHD